MLCACVPVDLTAPRHICQVFAWPDIDTATCSWSLNDGSHTHCAEIGAIVRGESIIQHHGHQLAPSFTRQHYASTSLITTHLKLEAVADSLADLVEVGGVPVAQQHGKALVSFVPVADKVDNLGLVILQ